MSINQNLLDYITNLYNNNILQTSVVTGMNDKVKAANVSLNQLDVVQKNGLSRQNDIKKIITDESKRLNEKKTTIDQAVLSQNRIIYFNDNNRKIYGAYLRLLIVLTITLAIVWLIRIIKKHIEIIPDWILDICIIITVSIGLIIMYNYYIDIQIRSKYNFDEINLNPPVIKTEDTASSSTNGPLNDSGSLCVGAECCKPATKTDPGSVWDEEANKCINEPILQDGFNTMNSVKPVDAFEYNDYSPYK